MKSNVIKKEDYYLYDFVLPLSKIGKKEKSFIYHELEKCHPCFSERSCIDSYKYLSGGKLHSKVVVMEKSKLANYKKNSAKGLYLENLKNRKFFKSDHAGLLFFVIPFLFSIIAIVVLYIMAFMENKIRQTQKTEESTVLSEYVESPIQAVNFTDEEKFFDDVSEKITGKDLHIDSVSYSRIEDNDFVLHNVEMSIRNCVPEDVDDIFDETVDVKVSPVIYEQGIPSFSIIYSYKTNFNEENLPETEIDLKGIRKLILACGGIVHSESGITNEIDFSISGKNYEESLQTIIEYLMEGKMGIKNMNVAANGESVRMNMQLVRNTGNVFFARMLKACGKNMYELPCENTVVTNEIVTPLQISVEEPVSEVQGEKIGMITKADGTKVVYLRMENGTIKEVKQ